MGETAWALTNERNHASWWIETYGLADRSNTAFLDRAEAIFPRVSAAADKRANRLPTLVILNAKGSPFAMALPDGSVLLTKGALEICYRNRTKAIGDARLAFVIGHELAHLGNDDFWHAAAFEALEQHATRNSAEGGLKDLMRPSEEEAKRRELHADTYGMLYMTIAGFDPSVLLGEESFFAEWADQLRQLGLKLVAEQATPRERSAMVQSHANAISGEIDFYQFGVRLIQIGRFQDGLLLLEQFRDRFPSREVLNNIGYAHFQLAVQRLGECDGRLVVRFQLPTVVDPDTRVSHLRSGGGSVSPCFQQPNIRRHLEEAERNLKEAAGMDSVYLPARLNLYSTYAIAGKGAQALVVAEEALEIDDQDRRARAARAVALYLYGEQSGLATADSAIEQLEELLREDARDAANAYNRAAILSERGRVQTARDAFSSYLNLEKRGIYADAARDYLDEARNGKAETPVFSPVQEPPIQLGRLSKAALEAKFPDLRLSSFSVGSFSGVFIHFSGGQALAIDETIEFVEERVQPPLSEAAALARYGESIVMIDASSERVLLYEGFALVCRSDGVISRLYFAE
jgi:tetratricopeptide (TPR) repeat protein